MNLFVRPELESIEDQPTNTKDRIRTVPVMDPREKGPNHVREVSFYVPCFNGERYIAPTLRAIFCQTIPPKEVIVVDDGSTDKTSVIAVQLGARVIRHEKNKGLAAARNTGIRYSSGELIASIDADVVLRSDWLETLLPLFNDDTVAGAGGRCIEFFQQAAPDEWRALHLVQDLGPDDLVITPDVDQGLSGFAAVFRKSALESVGGYNEAYRTNWEDWDICVRLRRAGNTLIYHTPAIAFHMRQDTAISVVETAWRWVFWIRYNQGLYERLDRKLSHNLGRAYRKALQHARSRAFRLLLIDGMYFVFFCYWDIRYFLGKWLKRTPYERSC